MHWNEEKLTATWKERATTRHTVAGVRTWHVNLNPRAMHNLGFAKGEWQDTNRHAGHVDWRGPFAAQAGALIVEVTTDKGLKGYGLGGGGAAGALIIEKHLQHFVIGRDPLDVEAIWERLYHITSIYGRRGLVIYALSGLELALVDVCGKIVDAPVYSLITENPRLKIPAYATGGDVGYYAENGFRACKLPLRHGLAEGENGFAENVEMMHAARDAVGAEVELMADIYLRWDVDYTTRFAETTADLHLKWIEEPIPLDDYAGMAALVRDVQPTWIVSGEHEFTRYGFRELLRWKAADMVQPDISWAGGFTECLRIAHEAAAVDIPTWLHQAATPWGLHLTACLPMPCMAETFGPSREGIENELYRRLRPAAEEGFFTVPDAPGFGVDIDEALLEAYSVERV